MACTVPNCPSRVSALTTFLMKNDTNVSFHRFPADPDLKKTWIKNVKKGDKWNPSQHTRICSLHFDVSCFREGYVRRLLHSYAVPTIFPLLYKPRLPKKTKSTSTAAKSNEERCRAASSHGPSLSVTPHTTDRTSTSGSLRCSFCSSPLQKIYKCVQCEDVLLCDECERSDRHPIHCVLRIASEDLYVKVKETFPTLHRLFEMLLMEDEDTKAGDSDATRSATETDLEDEMQNISKVCSNVIESTIDTHNKHKKSHRKVKDYKSSRTTDTKHQPDSGHSKKRKHNTVAGNTKKPTSVQQVNTKVDEPTIPRTETSPTHNDQLDIYYTIKTEVVGEDNTTNLESMDVIIEHDIKQQVKEEPDDGDISDEVSPARVTYFYRVPNNMK